jgi:hypothetical protein
MYKTPEQKKIKSWPTPQDYNEALQNPAVVFKDEELRKCIPEADVLGLPRPTSGAFASVYKVTSGNRTFAVRCFLRNIHDQKERYAKISEFIGSDKLPYTVTFEYQEEGIRIGNTWYPIVKMDWVEGATLEAYVARNAFNPKVLERLLKAFRQMCLDLRDAGIAHGDLQHGNVLVLNDGQLRLVDYDGMFVPSMKGWQSNELGHRNYQHPNRGPEHFGPELDTFSAWIIYASIQATLLKPSIFSELGGGDDCLLFHRQDFDHPSESRAFQTLEKLPHAGPQLATSLKQIINGSPLEYRLLPSSSFNLVRSIKGFFYFPPRDHKLPPGSNAIPSTSTTARSDTIAITMEHASQEQNFFPKPKPGPQSAIADKKLIATYARVQRRSTRTKQTKGGIELTEYQVELEYRILQNQRYKAIKNSITLNEKQWRLLKKGDDVKIACLPEKPEIIWWDSYTDKRFAGETESAFHYEYRKVTGVLGIDFFILLAVDVVVLGALPSLLVQNGALIGLAFSCFIALVYLTIALPQLHSKERVILRSGVAVRGRITKMAIRREPDSYGDLHEKYWLRYEYPRVVDSEMQELFEQWTEVKDMKWWSQHEPDQYITIVYNRHDWKQHLIYELCGFKCLPANKPFFFDD